MLPGLAGPDRLVMLEQEDHTRPYRQLDHRLHGSHQELIAGLPMARPLDNQFPKRVLTTTKHTTYHCLEAQIQWALLRDMTR